MRSRGLRSPDEWDAVALTFAEPVAPPQPFVFKWPRITGGLNWMAT